MAHKYFKSSTAPNYGNHGVQLSTGEFVFVVHTGATTADLVYASADRLTLTTIATLTTGGTGFFTGTAPAIARDNLDNLYVVGLAHGLGTGQRMQAFTKGAGLTWTPQTAVTGTFVAGTSAAGSTPPNQRMVWCNTGGGTGNSGHLLFVRSFMNNAGTDGGVYGIIDAGDLLAGTATVTASGNNPAFFTTGYYFTTAELSPDGFGAANGICVYGRLSSSSVSAWGVSNTGTLSTNTMITASLAISKGSGEGMDGAMPLWISSNLWAVVGPDNANGANAKAARYSATAQLTGVTTKNLSSIYIPVGRNGRQWWAGYDPSTQKAWFYYRDSTTKTTIRKLGASVVSGVTWDAADVVEDTGVATTSLGIFWGLVGRPVDHTHFDYGYVLSGTGAYGDFDEYNTIPNAPTLVSPLPASNQDLAAGFTFDWTFSDPDTTDTQSAYYFRRKIVGAGSYEYWNAGTGTWQATEVKNSTTDTQVTFAASKWTNGNTYQWSVATEDNQIGYKGPYASDITVVADTQSAVTVTGPSGSVTTTSRPAVTWSFSDAESNPQQTFQVKIETGAYGSNPGVGTPVLDSGEVSSVDLRTWTPTADLTNGSTFRAFVRVKTNGQYSLWAFSTFTMALTPPAAPTLSTAFESALCRVEATVTGTHATASFPTTMFRLQKSDDGGTTWQDVRSGTATGNGTPGATPVVFYDYEAPLFRQRQYRAFTDATV